MKLVFLHGLGQDKTAWDDVITALPHYDCLALDLFDEGKCLKILRLWWNKLLLNSKG